MSAFHPNATDRSRPKADPRCVRSGQLRSTTTRQGVYEGPLDARWGGRLMSELQLDGGCLCGAVRFECRSKVLNAYKCHCRECQQSSGGGFMGVMWVHDRGFRFVKGEPKFHMSVPSAGRELHRGFCADCGATVIVRNTAAKGLLFIVPSALDDPSVFAPRMEIWTGRAYGWDLIDATTPTFEGQPSDQEMLSFATF